MMGTLLCLPNLLAGEGSHHQQQQQPGGGGGGGNATVRAGVTPGGAGGCAQQQQQQLLQTWVHYKAYVSAFGSWVKAWSKLLQDMWEENRDDVVLEKHMKELGNVVKWLFVEGSSIMSWDLASAEGGQQGQWAIGAFAEAAGCKPAPSGIQLVLLLWTARPLAAASQLLRGLAAAKGDVQRDGSSVGGNGAAGVTSAVTGRSSSSGAADGWDLTALPRFAAALSVVVLMQHRCLVQWQGLACGGSSSSSSNRRAFSAAAAAAPAGVPSVVDAAEAASLADALKRVLPLEGGEGSSDGGRPAANSARDAKTTSPSRTAAAAGAASSKERTFSSAPKGSSSSSSGNSGSIAKQPKHMSKRLSKLPQQGLPAAVTDQLQLITLACPGVAEMLLDCSGALNDLLLQCLSFVQQEEVLQQLVQLNNLLLAEVPLPVGCSNPACLSLVGDSEVKASKKACTACKVVYYCSRECQVAHWDAHKALCKKLRK